MGLDSYIVTNSKTLCDQMAEWNSEHREHRWYDYMPDDGIIAYWRKANMVHGWFERHCPHRDGEPFVGDHEIGLDTIDELVADLEKVCADLTMCDAEIERTRWADLDKVVEKRVERKLADDSVARELMPATDGFFFGYDEYNPYNESYVADVKDALGVMRHLQSLLPGSVGHRPYPCKMDDDELNLRLWYSSSW